MMCSRLLKAENPRKRAAAAHGMLYYMTEGFYKLMLAAYDWSLKIVLRHQAATLAVAVSTLVLTVWLYIDVPKGFLPQQDTGLIVATIDADQSVSFEAMTRLQRQVAEIAERDPDVAGVDSFIGAGTINATPNTGHVTVALKPHAERHSSANEIIARLEEQFRPLEGIAVSLQLVQDIQIGSRASRTRYQYTLVDADKAEVEIWAPRLIERLKTMPVFEGVASDQMNGALLADLQIDRDQASRLGVTAQTVDDTLYDAFGQRQVSTIYSQLNQYHVVLETTPNFQLGPESLHQLYVPSTTGAEQWLSAFTTLARRTAPLAITHQAQFPAVTLSFNLKPGESLSAAVQAIRTAERDIGLPDTVQGSFAGEAAEFQSSLQGEPYLILAAIVAVYIVLGILYESLIHPLTIISTLPSAGIGALLALRLFGYDLSIIGLIAIVLLIGIVKKNAIMMIDFALEAQREGGQTPGAAIYQACLLRFRPIMMTTMAALLGAVPLAVGHATGSEMRRPLGIAIVGGLIFSQALTLFTTPVVYIMLDRLRGRQPAKLQPAM